MMVMIDDDGDDGDDGDGGDDDDDYAGGDGNINSTILSVDSGSLHPTALGCPQDP